MRIKRIALSAALTLLIVGALPAQSTELDKPVRIKAGDAVIDTGKDIGHAGPLFVDHDRDGLSDLLVSAFRGNIRFFKNVGSRTQPAFVEKEPLQMEGGPLRIHNW